jgi:PTS system nitrogen regulatory IIA component
MSSQQEQPLVTPSRVACGARCSSKKKSLELVAELLESGIEHGDDTNDDEMEVIDALAARERLGCTGMGHGIAIPHGRVDFVDEPVGAIAILDEPVNFDAPDGQPVDIIYGLLMPEEQIEEHLEVLADLARFFHSEDNRQALRSATDASAVLRILDTGPDGGDSASA